MGAGFYPKASAEQNDRRGGAAILAAAGEAGSVSALVKEASTRRAGCRCRPPTHDIPRERAAATLDVKPWLVVPVPKVASVDGTAGSPPCIFWTVRLSWLDRRAPTCRPYRMSFPAD